MTSSKAFDNAYFGLGVVIRPEVEVVVDEGSYTNT